MLRLKTSLFDCMWLGRWSNCRVSDDLYFKGVKSAFLLLCKWNKHLPTFTRVKQPPTAIQRYGDWAIQNKLKFPWWWEILLPFSQKSSMDFIFRASALIFKIKAPILCCISYLPGTPPRWRPEGKISYFNSLGLKKMPPYMCFQRILLLYHNFFVQQKIGEAMTHPAPRLHRHWY